MFSYHCWCYRFLEEGNIEAAEMQKQRIEQLQRERRKVLEENNLEHQPRFFRYYLITSKYYNLLKFQASISFKQALFLPGFFYTLDFCPLAM